jgi:nucleobase:cation symporter-1, NCS1 family
VKIETRSIDYIPLAERHGKVRDVWPVWFSGGAQLGTVATGMVSVELGLDLAWSMVALLVGSALGTLFMALHSTQGPQLGLPQMIQSRPQFGRHGALLVWAVALVTYTGFNAFGPVLAAQTVRQIFGLEPTSVIVLFAASSVALAVFGYDSIHSTQRWLAYALVSCMVVFCAGVGFLHVPVGDLRITSFHAVPFLIQLFASTAYQLSWSIYVSDYSRYLPPDVSPLQSFLSTYFGCWTGGAWMMGVGAVVAALNPHAEVAFAVQRSGDGIFNGFGTMLLLAALAGLLTTTSLNFYGASLTLLSAIDTVKPIQCTRRARVMSLLGAGTAATTAALFLKGDYVSSFKDLLTILLYLFTPWTSINLVDFFLVRHGRYSIREIFNINGIYGHWNWRGLTAYAVGFAAMIPFFSTGFYMGPIARWMQGADVAMLVGLPVAAITYLLACRSLDLETERRQVASADRYLEPGPAARPNPSEPPELVGFSHRSAS